uniref:Membrane protein BRI3 n=1 Tax=Plectus sambesii TaxID=2011161 RepID=A0A914VDK1_9BILA
MSINPNHASAPAPPPPPPSAYPWAEIQQPKTFSSPPPQYEAPPPSAYPAMPNQHYPSAGAISNHFNQQQHHQNQYVTSSAPVMNVSVNQIQDGSCRHCHAGLVISQSNMCCFVFLIVMTILTFPLGLLFLCCLPCAVEQRCNACHRL